MADSLPELMQELESKFETPEELMAYLKAQGITNEFTKSQLRSLTCPLAQYFGRITGKIIQVHCKQISSRPLHLNIVEQYPLPPRLEEFVIYADSAENRRY